MVNMLKVTSKSGFSLLQMSILLTVGGIMLAASLPGMNSGGEMDKTAITIERMEAIEEAMQSFMTENQRRPYPSDITAGFDDSTYGTELATPTDYSSVPTTHFTTASTSISFTRTIDDATLTSGTTSALTKDWLVSGTGIRNYSWIRGITSSTELELNQTASATGTSALNFRNPLVAGGVPVKALGLPDEYAMDGFGRRIVYMVDSRATTESGCMEMMHLQERGALALSNDADFSTGTYDHVMAALLSYGEDGQGAVGIQGAALTNRIKTANTDTATLNNAFYDTDQATEYEVSGLVNKTATSSFDDIVWVSQPIKNTCALGNKDSTRDFRIDGGGNADGTSAMAFGDINGDGYPDIVMGVAQQELVRVIFGRKDSWPEPNTAYDSSAVDGTNGFTITKGTENMTLFGTTISIGDVNGDGYDDIIASGVPDALTETGTAVIFGKRNWPASTSISSLTSSTGFLISNLYNTSGSTYIITGDINADGFDDIGIPINSDNSEEATATDDYGNFDGNNDLVSTDVSSDYQFGDNFSLSVWVYFDTLPTGSHQIIGTHTASSGYEDGFLLNQFGSNLYVYYKSANTVKSHMSQLTTGGWHHIVITNNGGTMYTYYNGSAIGGSYTSGGAITSSTLAVDVGGTSTGVWTSLDGRIADARLYNDALSSTEVTYLYSHGASGSNPGTANLVARWKFNEGAGTSISDGSGNGHHGTAENITESTFWPSGSFNAGQAIIYGKASGWSDIQLETAFLDGTEGVYFNVTTPSEANGDVSYGTNDATSFSRRVAAICNLNGDAYQDIIIPGLLTGDSVSDPQRFYFYAGATSWSDSSGYIDASSGSKLNFSTSGAHPAPYNVLTADCKDINNDGIDDLLMYLKSTSTAQEYIYVYYGRSTVSTINLDSNYSLKFDMTASDPSWQDASSVPWILVGDVNSDGRNDIIFTRPEDDPNVTIDGTTFTVNADTSGTTRSNAGTTYILYQPATWGSAPVDINWFGDYTYDGTDGLQIIGAVASDTIRLDDVGDMNNDGKIDLLLRTNLNPTGGYFIFGKDNWPTPYDLNCTRAKTGTHCPDQFTAQ